MEMCLILFLITSPRFYKRVMCARQTGKVGSLGSSSGRNQEEHDEANWKRTSLVSNEGVHVRGAGPWGEGFPWRRKCGTKGMICPAQKREMFSQVQRAIKWGDGLAGDLLKKLNLAEIEADGRAHDVSLGQFSSHHTEDLESRNLELQSI